ncbi:MAG: L,D-transpeptidase family protein [Streptosporangiaceae bacterium]
MRRLAGWIVLVLAVLLTQACLGESASSEQAAGNRPDRSPVAQERTATPSPRSSVRAAADGPAHAAPSAAADDATPAQRDATKRTKQTKRHDATKRPKKPKVLSAGDEGPKVRALQRRLKTMHYDPGVVDGVFGGTTEQAVWAFQRVNRLRADGAVGPKTRAALADPRAPRSLEPGGPADRVEIDLTHQVLYVYKHDQLALISHISSGSGEYYCSENGCAHAVTPTGDFHTTWRVHGWRTSDLGRLYNPVYFVGGIAVHGAPYVPPAPASHGCVRIPMHTGTIFPGLVSHGEAVFVRSP